MQFFSKLKRWKLAYAMIIAGFMALLLLMHACMTFRMSEKEISRHFAKKNIPVIQESFSVQGRRLHYVATGKAINPTVVFVHGSPGSLSAFIDFLSDSLLLSKAYLVTIDRPGFGYSNFGKAEPSLEKQAALLKPLLDLRKSERPIILVGHSLGAPVIARMAMDYPDLVDALVLVAGSIDPDLEPNEKWFRVPMASPFMRWMLPRSFRASNDEILKAKEELTRMLPLWKNIQCPVVVIHGEKDVLVPVANVAYAEKMLNNDKLTIIRKKDVNHFIPWSHPELIQQALLEALASYEQQ